MLCVVMSDMKVAALPGASRAHAVRQWAGFRGGYLLRVTWRWRSRTTSPPRSASRSSSPVRSPPSSGCRSGSPSPSSTSAESACGRARSSATCWSTRSGTPHRHRGGPDVRQSARGAGPTLLMRRLIPRGAPLASVGGLARMVVAIAAGATVSATVGAVSLRLGGVIDTGAVPDVWRTWWLGDFAGALVVVPVALAWSRPLPRRWPRGRAIEGGADGRGGRRGRASSRSAATSPWPTSSFRP